MWDLRKLSSDPEWDTLEYGVKQEYRKDSRAALAAADALVTEQMVASAILMVTQGDVSPEYAWEVQYPEVQDELLAQARAVLALIGGGDE
jgi:hypothetical protein